MRRIHIIAILLGVVLPILGACASPAATAPTAALAPAPTTPAPRTLTVAPAPTTLTAAPAPVRGAFVVSQLRLDPESIMVGENVTASVVVANTGVQRGTYTVVLRFNGETIATKDVTLDGGSSEKVTFKVMAEKLGEFKVTVDDLATKLLVDPCPV